MTDPRLRLILITDGAGDLARIEAVVAAALRGGCRCVQLRERAWSARQHAAACERLQPLLAAAGGLLLVNDRVDVAAAGLAHGAQVGHRSLAPRAARQALPRPALLGSSTHDAQELDEAAAAGCDFALLAPVWDSSSKPGRAGMGVAAAGALTAASSPMPTSRSRRPGKNDRSAAVKARSPATSARSFGARREGDHHGAADLRERQRAE